MDNVKEIIRLIGLIQHDPVFHPGPHQLNRDGWVPYLTKHRKEYMLAQCQSIDTYIQQLLREHRTEIKRFISAAHQHGIHVYFQPPITHPGVPTVGKTKGSLTFNKGYIAISGNNIKPVGLP